MEKVERLHRPVLRDRYFRTCLARILAWSARARQRRRLVELDERRLKDLGLSRADARREAAKPFWRG